MRKATTILLFLALFYFSGCSGPVTVRMDEYVGKKADCAVPVIDERTEKRLIVDYDGTSDVFELSPPLQEILSYQICQSQAIKKYAESKKDFKVIIKDLNATRIPYGYESELTVVLIGYIQDGNEKGGIRSPATKDTTEVTGSLVRDLVHQTITDFTSKIENYVKQPGR
jgi:hypothetical protein